MKTIKRAYKFRIYPTAEQEVKIRQTIGCSRLVYNHFLAECDTSFQSTGKRLSYGVTSKGLTSLKKVKTFLKDVDSIALQATLEDLDDAWKRFFNKQNKRPVFKSKKRPRQSYTTKNVNDNLKVVDVDGVPKLKVPKLGLVRVAWSRQLKEETHIRRATIQIRPSGKVFISLLVEETISPLPTTNEAVGIDLGVTQLATLSDGTMALNPRNLKSMEAKLIQAQRVLSRRIERAKKDGRPLRDAKNVQKARMKVARIHETIANRRNDTLHKLTTEWVRRFDTIAIEDLETSKMLKNSHLARSISDASWSTMRQMLTYKCDWHGRTLILVKPNDTSRRCHECGHIDALNRPTQTEFACVSCGHTAHADVNGALNILARAQGVW
ncbi:hypothetical protein JMA_38850 (plasmid) [Jeotgalibacillus malaysiensis]|uniref:Transposase n=1 Tax=Jeotgalibacillus malaysiensis TaxID=1508404 RepID=A0A0B5AXA9_9BACL|nr:RNA-guided endonuclease TnpB family protein [Jeotgalibacillus malaysiensis]AJD93203.1 hypothetical protein JMA_38850 [Jeotgalibacillus malaysiensis]